MSNREKEKDKYFCRLPKWAQDLIYIIIIVVISIFILWVIRNVYRFVVPERARRDFEEAKNVHELIERLKISNAARHAMRDKVFDHLASKAVKHVADVAKN
uniref:Uncharacterized protein n=1 Tax=Mimivirus LCMiAC01 TaxID=2506608 RepID=A0A481YZ30_9VIRU|nr:MAG: hypothetical protein LCMiAC01_01890 [Mimivirus LCMiAC01]